VNVPTAGRRRGELIGYYVSSVGVIAILGLTMLAVAGMKAA